VKYRVRLTFKAEADIDTALGWFHENQAAVAGERWFAQLMSKIDTLETFPERCGIAEESDELGVEIRQLLIGKRHGIYRILFLIDDTTVQILRVWHSARDRIRREDL
jgi:plasmid stabilization system protein ParE